jgi:histidyl-tRNA synthetase
MKKADGSGARYAVIIGADEIAAQQVSVKPLRETVEQTRCTVADAAAMMVNTMDSKRG